MTDNEKVLDFVAKLLALGFWGSLTLKIENGRVVHVIKEQNIKPSELPK